jgi:hypothetical protein
MMKIRAKSEMLPRPVVPSNIESSKRMLLRASSLDHSERDLIKAFERAEQRRSDRPQLSPTDAFTNERNFIQATLHTMPLRSERPSRL